MLAVPARLDKSLLWLLSACTLLFFTFSVQAAGFALKDVNGKLHRLTDYRGKWVLINFWASWCPPCLSEIPDLVDLHNAHKDRDLVVLGIAIDSGSRVNVANFARQHGITYPTLLGNAELATQIGPFDALPTSYLYAPNGMLVSYKEGMVTRESIENYIATKKFH